MPCRVHGGARQLAWSALCQRGLGPSVSERWQSGNGLHIPLNFVTVLGFLLLGSEAERSGDERVSVHGGDGAEGGPDPVDDHVLHVGVPGTALMHDQSELYIHIIMA